MAYRNHPTRYLIVKDPGRLGPGPPHSAARREPRVVTPGRPPCQHLFFNFPHRRSRRGRASGFPKRRCVSTRPRPARQHFFSTWRASLSRRAPCSGFTKRRGYLPDRVRPVNTFFQAPGESFFPGPRFRLPVVRRSASTRPRRHRQHVFSTSARRAFAPPAVPRFPEAEGLSTRPHPARQHLFSRFRGIVLPRTALPVSRRAEVRFYAAPTTPSTRFFNLSKRLRLLVKPRRGFPQRGVAVYVGRAGPSSQILPSFLVFSKTSSIPNACESHFPGANA